MKARAISGPTGRRVAPGALLALLLVVMAACSGKAKVEPRRPLDTTPAPGSVVVSDTSIGFAISIPTSWKTLPTDFGRFDAAAGAIRSGNDKVAVGLDQLRSIVRGGVAMAAIDPDTGSTVNVSALEAAGQNPVDIAKTSASQLSSTGATGFTRESLTVDGVPAVRQRFHAQVPGLTGAVDLNKAQLYLVRRGQAFIVSTAGDSPALDGIATSLKLA